MRILLAHFLMLSLFFVSGKGLASTFGIGLKTGLFIAPISGTGIDVTYDTGDLSFGLSYISGNWDGMGLVADVNATSLEKFDVNGTLALLEGRYFFSAPWNFSFGIGQRNIDLDYAATDIYGNRLSGELKTSSMVSNLGIGAIGRWESFYFGLDIIAFTRPFGTSVSNVVRTNIPNSASELQSLNEDLMEAGEELGKATTGQFLTLLLGVRF